MCYWLNAVRKESRLPSFAWTLDLEEMWTWDGESWVLSDLEQQPERHGTLLAGTHCARRSRHVMKDLGTGYVTCRDCGWTLEAGRESLVGQSSDDRSA